LLLGLQFQKLGRFQKRFDAHFCPVRRRKNGRRIVFLKTGHKANAMCFLPGEEVSRLNVGKGEGEEGKKKKG